MHITAHRSLPGLLAGLLLALGSHHASAYDTCLPPVENQVASNIADPYPEGRVNNAAPTPMGVDLPEQGLLGATPVPAPDDRGVFTNIKWGPAVWNEPTRGCAQTRQVFDAQPAKDYDPYAADGKTFPTSTKTAPPRRGKRAATSTGTWPLWREARTSTSSR